MHSRGPFDRHGKLRVKTPLNLIMIKVETPYHDNDLILTPIISPQKWLTMNLKLYGTSYERFQGWRMAIFNIWEVSLDGTPNF
jgi:hypothetical protein